MTEFDQVLEVGVSHQLNVSAALDEALSGLNTGSAAFLLVFASSHMDSTELSETLHKRIFGTPVFGCTTAGQITHFGYEDHGILVLCFPKKHYRCQAAMVSPLRSLDIDDTAKKITAARMRLQPQQNWNRFAIVLADGLSQQEDTLVAAIEAGAGGVPVFGGSAGDGLKFEHTHLVHGGKAHEDAGLAIFVDTDLPFVGLGFDHFLPTNQNVVVTLAAPEKREVIELNGSPAALEYARQVGCEVKDLSPAVFAENPLLVRNGNAYHVRAVQEVREDNKLAFLSAIDDGLILKLGEGKEILRTLKEELDISDPAGRRPAFILGFDCVLRRLEIEQKGLEKDVSQILSDSKVLGFCTYGEQHRGVHVNQTFVGIAVFPPKSTVQ